MAAKTSRPQTHLPSLVWSNILLLLFVHIFGTIGTIQIFTKAKISTTIYAVFLAWLAAMGITAGAHRLWTHRTYKATLPLRLLLAFCQTMSLQTPIYVWVRDHRVHHKFTDTDADPHNAKRGFFFSHMGWLMVKKHPDVTIKGKSVDLSDLEADPVVMVQKKLYLLISPILCLVLPALVPWYYWGEDLYVSWGVSCMCRYMGSLHGTWAVNSVAHIWGNKPYDSSIQPSENLAVAIFAFGEGWHNYHHVFPWDYKTSELGDYKFNLTTGFIDFMAKIGWAYDLKTANPRLIQERVKRTGEKSRRQKGNDNDSTLIWGWGDDDITTDNLQFVETLNKKVL